MALTPSLLGVIHQMTQHWDITFRFVSIFIVTHIATICSGGVLRVLGVWPRKIWGLVGIIPSSFLHSSLGHLIFNLMPLTILTHLLMFHSVRLFVDCSAFIILFGGMGVWLLGRSGVHVGASMLIMGYWAVLVRRFVDHPDLTALVSVALGLYYFGGFLTEFFSHDRRVSVEGHIIGFGVGWCFTESRWAAFQHWTSLPVASYLDQASILLQQPWDWMGFRI